jgi:hypothetical protein
MRLKSPQQRVWLSSLKGQRPTCLQAISPSRGPACRLRSIAHATLDECASLWQAAADVMSGAQREDETSAQFVDRVAMMRHVLEGGFLARAPAQVVDMRAEAGGSN